MSRVAPLVMSIVGVMMRVMLSFRGNSYRGDSFRGDSFRGDSFRGDSVCVSVSFISKSWTGIASRRDETYSVILNFEDIFNK